MKFKSGILFFLVSLFAIAVNGQKIKLYAYSQEVTPGVPRKTATLNSNEEVKQQVKIKTNYWIYVMADKTASLIPKEVWINGKGYTIEVTGPGSDSIRLSDNQVVIAEEGKKILKLTPNGSISEEEKISPKLKGCIKKNELVVVYSSGKKEKHKGLKHISKLGPFHMQ